MNGIDVLMITFSVVAANHLGLVAAMESVIKHSLPIVNCPKCATFWLVLACGSVCCDTIATIPATLAVAFLSAWSAIWLDLFMGLIDKLYIKLYDSLYPTTNSADTDALSAADTMPDMSDAEC